MGGTGYDVDLCADNPKEKVSVRFLEGQHAPYVLVRGSGDGPLFERVVGRVIWALSANSDNLQVDRHGEEPNHPAEPASPSQAGSS